MAVDIADLSEEKFPPKFTIESELLGQLGFRRVYGIDHPYLTFRTNTGSDDEFVSKLMVHMGWRMDGPARLSDVERTALTRADMEAFCQALIEHEPSIFEDTKREAAEDPLAYVRRKAGQAVKDRKGPFTNSAMLDMEDSFQRNVRAAAHMKSLLGERPFELPVVPRNPIVDTNSILGRVEAQISRMANVSEASAELQSSLNDYARSAITRMKAGSDQTERNAGLALRVGLAGVVAGVVSAVVSMLTWLWASDQQAKAEVVRASDAKAAAQERRADRRLMQQQLEAMQRNADLLEKRLPSPAKKAKGGR